MTPEEVTYVRYRVARGKETLEDAQVLLVHGHLHSVMNRIYYACFYVVDALLRTEGMGSTKHSGVLSLFDKHWVKSGRMPLEMARFYREMFNQRQVGDYAAVLTVDRADAEGWLQQAEAFVEHGSQLVERALPT
jgi:uncharacterized protein